MAAPYLTQYARVDDFDPKAITRASWQPQLLNPQYNRHPDSYVKPYGVLEVQPLASNTKKVINIMRWSQFALRTTQMIGALGLLACAIILKTKDSTDAVMLRATPALGIVIVGYAMYYLVRSPSRRPAATQTSYHIFSIITDVCMISLLVYTALTAHSKIELDSSNSERWTSFFDDDVTFYLMHATWIDCAAIASIHLVTAIMSIYMAHVFRQISELPPDMNPLEDNLTSRKHRKHKYKNSEMTMSESTLVGSTISLDKERYSMARDYDMRPVTFLASRAGADTTYSAHNPSTAQLSRKAMDFSNQPSRPSRMQRRLPSHKIDELPISRVASSAYSLESTVSELPPVPRRSSKRETLTTDTWFVTDEKDKENQPMVSVVEGDFDDDEPEQWTADRNGGRAFGFGSIKRIGRVYHPVSTSEAFLSPTQLLHSQTSIESFTPIPLGMNPPTPPLEQDALKKSKVRIGISPLSSNLQTLPKSPKKSVGTPTKTKYYGDLSSAMAGVRGKTPDVGAPEAGHFIPADVERRLELAKGGRTARVVSSGREEDHSLSIAGLRDRRVSGKVAEEGRGGLDWSH